MLGSCFDEWKWFRGCFLVFSSCSCPLPYFFLTWSYSFSFRVKPKHFSLRFVVFPMAPCPNPRRLHTVLWLTTTAQPCWNPTTRSEYSFPPGLSIQDWQDLANLRHPDHQECSPIRSTFFPNPTGIEERALFLWAQQYTPAFARAQTLVGFCQVFPSTVGTMGSWHARGLVRDSPSRLVWRYVPGEPL